MDPGVRVYRGFEVEKGRVEGGLFGIRTSAAVSLDSKKEDSKKDHFWLSDVIAVFAVPTQ